MKNQIILAVLTVFMVGLIASCTKKTDPAPADAATIVAGVYDMTNLRLDSAGISLYNYTLPYTKGTNTLSGAITVRRDSASVIYATYTIKQTGQTDYNDFFGQLKLQGTTAPYDIYGGTTKIGTTDGKTFTIDFSYIDTDKVKYRAVYAGQKKQ